MNASIGKRDATKQGHRTPPEFLRAVEARFGDIVFDLAATPGHEVRRVPFFSPEQDALAQDWTTIPLLNVGARGAPVRFLNPPFADVLPWASKLDEECRLLPVWTIALVQASSDAKWWQRHVHNRCMVFDIPRVKFVGSDHVFPKPLACLAYGFGVCGRDWWDWKKEI